MFIFAAISSLFVVGQVNIAAHVFGSIGLGVAVGLLFVSRRNALTRLPVVWILTMLMVFTLIALILAGFISYIID